ncbi:hypothetical protein KDW_31010 [Dictyobacter vulcani]|uniref:Uncharacterized protein n=1 Tax=Dictyobacter vulcani TaxID=2607529 RepID=A0A5J4KS75_9CHLR|nr:hypothetical protein [Dictyobacter vulcani]GER88939.1 hypothetical protein KDW_31010 [Dictyobacter vulcani]
MDPSEQKRQWLERELKYNRERIERICEQYQVRTLDQLSEAQFVHLANRIYVAQQRAQQKKNGSTAPRRVVAASAPATVQQ